MPCNRTDTEEMPPTYNDPVRLGIDLGTTRVAVAAADRGNFPIVSFDAPDGSMSEWFPSLVAERDGQVRTGFAAVEAIRREGWRGRRSLKRALSAAGPTDTVFGRSISELATLFLADLAGAIRSSSNLEIDPDEPLEAAIAVPANATANQRMLTADAFTEAGFRVVRVLDEPSAAGLEYAWRRPRDARVRRRHIAVYDLGGGTFDASVICLSDDVHEVLTTEGVQRLGGDDFDRALVDLVAERAGLTGRIDPTATDALLEACREAKETIGPSSRRVTVELPPDGTPVSLPMAEVEAAFAPLVQRTLEALRTSLARVAADRGDDVEKSTVIYQVGGGSSLPAVGRALRDDWGRRVWRCPYPHASVAIGLAIAAEDELSPRITSRLTRHFGVWREGEHGTELVFDTVFAKDTPLPQVGAAPLIATRRYRAVHDIAHFRFVEASRAAPDGSPAGDVWPWREVRFPLVRDHLATDLESHPVQRLEPEGPMVEERYECDADGVIRVEIHNLDDGYARVYDLHGDAGA
jgi:molecular chaperone DnaK (HSP70)